MCFFYLWILVRWNGPVLPVELKKSNFKEKDCCIKNVRQFGTAVWSAMANIYCKGERFFIHVFSSQIMSFRESNNLSTENFFFQNNEKYSSWSWITRENSWFCELPNFFHFNPESCFWIFLQSVCCVQLGFTRRIF